MNAPCERPDAIGAVRLLSVARLTFGGTAIGEWMFRRGRGRGPRTGGATGTADTAGHDLFASAYLDQLVLDRVVASLRSSTADVGVGGGGPLFDARRAATTVGYIQEFDLARGLVVDIGNPDHAVTRAVWEQFPDVRRVSTSHDLRREGFPSGDGSVDSLICLEVIEHLSDQHYAHATTLSGLFYFLEEVYRVLSVGGRALFTTPNATSFWAIQRALLGDPPLMWEWHFREFTPDEIRRILASVGFSIITLRTEFVWHLWDFGAIHRFMLDNGYRVDERGDDMFIVVEKPPVRIRHPHELDLPV